MEFLGDILLGVNGHEWCFYYYKLWQLLRHLLLKLGQCLVLITPLQGHKIFLHTAISYEEPKGGTNCLLSVLTFLVPFCCSLCLSLSGASCTASHLMR